ncbi:hypothetical protein BpHYR1_035002 [Brachionus plicatilis]|uniref:Uncharacterized protein n=1 Tax=Brachionus plicatilis TaxID=10195 RepID=A0A3M7Q093_BRAPC|nr:hypothetical protein BpHYR1_035002 [Brachionus plicatilis]
MSKIKISTKYIADLIPGFLKRLHIKKFSKIKISIKYTADLIPGFMLKNLDELGGNIGLVEYMGIVNSKYKLNKNFLFFVLEFLIFNFREAVSILFIFKQNDFFIKKLP